MGKKDIKIGSLECEITRLNSELQKLNNEKKSLIKSHHDSIESRAMNKENIDFYGMKLNVVSVEVDDNSAIHSFIDGFVYINTGRLTKIFTLSNGSKIVFDVNDIILKQ